MPRKKNHKIQQNTDINTIPAGGNGKVYIGFPRERILIPEFIDSRDLILMRVSKNGNGAGFFNANGHRVDKNRDRIVEAFLQLESKPEWLMQLDTDMEHPVDIIDVLMAHNKPIVGGLYFHRGDTHDPFVFKYIGELPDSYGRMCPHWAPMRSLTYSFLTKAGLPQADGSFRVNNPPFNPLVECDAVATGALLIHRSVLEKMQAPWFEYRNHAISEDLMFCKMARDLGYKIYCDLSVISGHYKMVPVGQAEFRVMYEALSVQATNFTKEQAYQDFSDYFGIPLDEAKRVIDSGSASIVGSYWNSVNPKTDDEVAAFYRNPETGKLYVVELMYWNMSEGFTRLRSNLRRVRDANVIELGSGIGTIGCQLAIQMNHVTMFEPNEVLRGFSQLRIKQMMYTPGMECIEPTVIQTEDWWNQVADESQDYILAFDVYEHIPLEELRKTIKHAASKLKKNARMLYHNNFGQQELYPMHFNHSKEWRQILEDAGLNEISPLEAIKI